MGMLDGVLSAIPSAAVGVLGMERDEQTHQPHEYYAKMPRGIADRTVFLIDPMLATGGSALSAIHYLREQGVLISDSWCWWLPPKGFAPFCRKTPMFAFGRARWMTG